MGTPPDATCAENSVKYGCVVPVTCEWRDRQTVRHRGRQPKHGHYRPKGRSESEEYGHQDNSGGDSGQSNKCIAVRKGCHTATGTHMPHGITQCYLPPGRCDIPDFTPAEVGTRLSDPGGMQGCVDLLGLFHIEMAYPPEDCHPSQY